MRGEDKGQEVAGMAFINLRRKKGIYLGGEMRGGGFFPFPSLARSSLAYALSLSFSFSILYFLFFLSPFRLVWYRARNRALGKADADRLVSPAIKRSLIRQCHFWRNHFRVISATRRWTAAAFAVLSLIPLVRFPPCSGRRPRRISTNAVAFLRSAAFN